MIKKYKIFSLFLLSELLIPHGVSESTANAMSDGSLIDYIYFGAEHMVTGYDHILFLLVFFFS